MSGTTERRFAPGDHYAVATETTTVLLPADQRGLAADLWLSADAGATFEELLDLVLSAGLAELGSFALVDSGSDAVRVLVRGDFAARVQGADGEQHVAAPDGHVWAEVVVSGATGVTVASGEVSASLALPAGIVRAAGVVLGTGAEPGPVSEPVAVSEAEAVSEPVAVSQPVVEAAPEDAAQPEAAVPSYGGMVAAPMLPEDPAESAVPDQDGPTFVSEMPDFDRPQVPGQEPAPGVVSRPVATLVFSTGEVVDVDRTVLVGRAPEARRFAANDQPVLVTVASPHQEISSTHLEVRPGAGADHGSAVATDLGSTNGTVIVQPGLSPEELQPGIAMSLVPGAVLDLGDGVTIQVSNP